MYGTLYTVRFFRIVIIVLLMSAGANEDEARQPKGNDSWFNRRVAPRVNIERSTTTGDGLSWEDRHVRATYWLDRGLREQVRKEAEGRGWSVSQFVTWALRKALDKQH